MSTIYASIMYLWWDCRNFYNYIVIWFDDYTALFVENGKVMRLYLVRMYRPKTMSIVKLHIDASCSYDVKRFAQDQLNWNMKDYIICNSPKEPYVIYKEVKIWPNHKVALFPGESKIVKLSSNNINSIQKEIKDLLCTL